MYIFYWLEMRCKCTGFNSILQYLVTTLFYKELIVKL